MLRMLMMRKEFVGTGGQPSHVYSWRTKKKIMKKWMMTWKGSTTHVSNVPSKIRTMPGQSRSSLAFLTALDSCPSGRQTAHLPPPCCPGPCHHRHTLPCHAHLQNPVVLYWERIVAMFPIVWVLVWVNHSLLTAVALLEVTLTPSLSSHLSPGTLSLPPSLPLSIKIIKFASQCLLICHDSLPYFIFTISSHGIFSVIIWLRY